MNLRRHHIIFLLIILCLDTTAQYGSLLHKTYAERYLPIDSIFFNPMRHADSASLFKKTAALEQAALEGSDHELGLEARLIHNTYYLSGLQKAPSKVEAPLLELRETADQENILQLRIRTRFILADYYLNEVNDYRKAFDNMLDAYALAAPLSVKDFPNKPEVIMGVASFYYHFGDMENARKYYLEAITYPPSYKRNYQISPLNTLGLIFRNEGKFDSADLYFRKTIDLAIKEGDSSWIGIGSGNLGISYYLQKRYVEAMPLLQLDVTQSIAAREYDNGVNSLLKLAHIHYLSGEKGAATTELSQARSWIGKTFDPYKHLQELYPLMAKMAMERGDHTAAYRFADSAIAVRDSMSRRMNALMLARSEQKLEMQKYADELKLKEEERKMNVWIRNSLIVLVVFIAIIAIMFINRQKLKHIQRQELLEAEKQLTRSELDFAQQQLEEFTRSVQQKNELIEKVTAELEKQRSLQNDSAQEAINNDLLVQLQQSTLLTDEQWDSFKNIFEKVHAGYLNRLKEKLPGLSPAETRFMALSKLKLSNKEMASMLGISADAIRMYRHRLRKKLDMAEDGSLEELVDRI